MKRFLIRSEHNPLITIADLPYQATSVFNAGAADLGDEVLLLLRVESCSGRSHLIVARSKDGETDWQVADWALLHADQGYAYETNGVEDCRITWMQDLNKWALAYVAYTAEGAGVALATTEDFETAERIGLVMPPDDKNPVLLGQCFDGLYAALHRPRVGSGGIWISYSPDLQFWGKPQLVLPARSGPWWDAVRVGAGFAPIETEHGLLLIYHGVKELAGAPVYRLGSALLDPERPHKTLARMRRWLLAPQEAYERNGDAPNVLFTCGGFVRGDDLWLYYGAADCSVCLAKGKVSDIVSGTRKDNIKETDGG